MVRVTFCKNYKNLIFADMMRLNVMLVLLGAFRILGTNSEEVYSETPQPPYDPTLRHSYSSPEPTLADLKDRLFKFRNISEWDFFYPHADQHLHLLSGPGEFTYVVEINTYVEYKRLPTDEHATPWVIKGIGTLLTERHILTTCRAITLFSCNLPNDHEARTCIDWFDCNCGTEAQRLNLWWGQVWNAQINVNFVLTRHDYQELLLERTWRYKTIGQVQLEVANQFFDPNCDWQRTLEHDWALVTLKKPIQYASVAPAPIYKGVLNNDRRLEYINERKIICTVPSYGRDMKGMATHLQNLLNSRVKYRVYPAHRNVCVSQYEYICPHEVCTSFTANHWNELRIECWETRAKIGAICDHDKGAPVVCDGAIQGIINRGAFHTRCNIGLPMAFLVARIYKDVPQFLEKAKIYAEDPFKIKSNPFPPPVIPPTKFPSGDICPEPNAGTSTGDKCPRPRPEPWNPKRRLRREATSSSSSLNPTSQFTIPKTSLIVSLIQIMVLCSN